MRMFGHEPLFRDRRGAGRALAARLERYRGSDALVVGLTRGGVVVAAEVARRLDAELDVVVVRKLGSPISPELAIGAVTASGERFLNEELIRELDVSEAYLRSVTAIEQREARQREARLRGNRPPPRIAGRSVIVVDDGLATGATMRAAVRWVREHSPARLVIAVPVGSLEACKALRAEADEVVCLHALASFRAVGSYYLRFEQTSDDEVRRLLQEAGPPELAAPAKHRH
jgi:putative phosphoribosyl transferase